MADAPALAPPSPRRRPRRWVAVLCFVLLGVVFWRAGHRLFGDNPWLRPPFTAAPHDRHIDEYAWYHYTYHYHLLVHQHRLAFDAWGDDVPAIGQPNGYKLALGAFFDLNGIPVNSSEATMRGWWQPLDDDAAFKAYLAAELPFPDRALAAGRWLSAVFSYLTIVLCAVYLARLTSLPVAVAGAAFVARLELFGVTRMMADSLQTLAFVICFLLADLAVQFRGRRPFALFVVALAVAAGLTAAVKLSGFLSFAFLPVALVARALAERSAAAWRSAAGWTLLHLGLACAVFVALHPQVYPNPVAGTARFFAHQLPATLGDELSLPGRVGDELVFQVGELAANLGRLLPGAWPRVGCVAAVVLLVALGLGRAVAASPRPALLVRLLPPLLTVAAFSVVLSHRQDDRYTWLVTIALAVVATVGLDALVAGVGRLARRSQPATAGGA